jgi:hypothetical protein
MTTEEILGAVRAIAERAGMTDDDELRALAEYARTLETDRLLDRELNLGTPETGLDLMVAAQAVLKRRGLTLDSANQDDLLAALREVSP